MAEVMAIHTDQLERYGGASGLRDPGILESALFRPQTGYYQDVVEEAAALWESLAQTHPFIDGSKRTAFASTYTFLAINGVLIRAAADDAYAFIAGLYETGSFRFEALAAWLRDNTVGHAL